MSFSIAIKNFSTVVSDDELLRTLEAFQTQVSRDFAPTWGINAHLRSAHQSDVLKPGEWLIGLYDDADQAGALGYHDVTSIGTPLGKVFAKTTIDDGGSWTVTFSHEMLEMLADPWINLTAFDPHSNRMYAYEACDAVEADELGYFILGTRVSDFVMPAFFRRDSSIPNGELFSFNGKLTAPFTLDAGGYLAYIDMNDPSAGWQQVMAQHPATSSGAGPNARVSDPFPLAKHAGTSRGARRRNMTESVERSTAP